MKILVLLLVPLTFLVSGCFDSSPPADITGEVVGCITTDNDLYCVTKYVDQGVTGATEVLIGEIDFDLPSRSFSFTKFHLEMDYRDENDDQTFYTVFVESLRREFVVEHRGTTVIDSKPFIRVTPGDTVAVAIVNPPTIQTPHQGYIIANLTRPEIEFEIPEEVKDVNILDLIP